jgi:hypothetical protein
MKPSRPLTPTHTQHESSSVNRRPDTSKLAGRSINLSIGQPQCTHENEEPTCLLEERREGKVSKALEQGSQREGEN